MIGTDSIFSPKLNCNFRFLLIYKSEYKFVSISLSILLNLLLAGLQKVYVCHALGRVCDSWLAKFYYSRCWQRKEEKI